MLLDIRTLIIISSSFMIAGFISYLIFIFLKKSRPNPASWAVWGFISILNFTTYRDMTGDWLIVVLPIVTSVFCVLTFFIVWRISSFRKLEKEDIAMLVLGVLAGIVWRGLHTADYANLIVQAGLLIGGIPTIRGVRRKPDNEESLPWFLWVAAYVVHFFVVKANSELGIENISWIAFVYPINSMFYHFVIGVLSCRKEKEKLTNKY